MATNSTMDQPIDVPLPMEVDGGTEAERQDDKGAFLSPRYYQLEMLEESLKRNIIVTMDTGSGKSLILAAQWYDVVSAQLPFIQTKFLSGADGVDRWRDQSTWDDCLQGVRTIVCTYQILLDALIHGFIPMSSLALIIFDEAHHCVAAHPANRIMRDFYHATEVPKRPAILGLTASPQTKTKIGDLEQVESNLDAIARTPKVHREELLRHVFQPQLICLTYQAAMKYGHECEILQKLIAVYSSLDIEQDPYVIKCRSDPSLSSSKQLQKILVSRKTYCQDQLKRFYTKSNDIHEELGSWATEFYMYMIIEKFCCKSSEDGMSVIDGLDETEKLYLKKILRALKTPEQTFADHDWSPGKEVYEASRVIEGRACLSAKVQCLIDFLAETGTEDFTGLVFVKTRAACAVLEYVLSVHHKTKDKIRVGTFVGTSSSPNRKFDMGELVDIKKQVDTLDHLRQGSKNLIIATSVLEEGIDVSACNVVICFEKPPNLIAFIQRRGRARKSRSKYVMMFPDTDSMSQLSTWQQLEDEMRQRYMDEMRQIEQLQELENAESGRRELCIETTGAKLTLDDSVQHLYHFCSTLPADPYVDLRPVFTFTEPAYGGDLITAKVRLPNSVDATVREASGATEWKSQKLAKRDAAFEAYVALYHAGLVSDNLLPIRGYDEAAAEAQSAVEKIVSLVDIDQQLDIWTLIARNWQSGSVLQSYNVCIKHHGSILTEMLMLFPWLLPDGLKFDIYLDACTTLHVEIRRGSPVPQIQPQAKAVAKITALLLRSVFRNRMENLQTDFIAHFIPAQTQDPSTWYKQNCGTLPACLLVDKTLPRESVGIFRDLMNNGVPYTFEGIEKLRPHCVHDQLGGAMQSAEEIVEDFIRAKRLPKRANFLHSMPSNADKPGSSFNLILAKDCSVDRLPFRYAQFALFIPSILHKIETRIVAEELCKNVLPLVGFSDHSLVLTAISTTAAQEPTNYQRLEFLGDSILKFFTSLTLLTTHLNWHEGVLSHQKDHIVSNSNLARANLAIGLDKYILTKSFTGQKWRPLYVSNLLSGQSAAKRQLSTKTLADVVESLIGAAYLDGGTTKALHCLQTLLPNTQWSPLDQLCATIHSTYDLSIALPPPYQPLETIIGHHFVLPSLLLEAITHPSHHGSTPSYQRLEFLGDSILDRIITVMAFNHTPSIETHTLHLIRTALVNASFLAYTSLTLSTPTTHKTIAPNPSTGTTYTTLSTNVPLALWTFMRHSSPSIRTAQTSCLARYQTLNATITTLLRTGDKYPWSLLTALEAPKFMSDIVESIIGAIFIDSKGSLEACEAFLERAGVVGYLRRVLDGQGGGEGRVGGKVRMKHPKEELGVVADTERVKYEVFRGKGEKGEGEGGGDGGVVEGAKSTENETERKELKCRVWIGERMVVEVGNGSSVIEVETRAAEEAVRMLKAEREGKGEGEMKMEL